MGLTITFKDGREVTFGVCKSTPEKWDVLYISIDNNREALALFFSPESTEKFNQLLNEIADGFERKP